MFNAPALKEHLENAFTVRAKAIVLAEINLNDFSRIAYMGNYKGIPSTFWSPDDARIQGGTVSYESYERTADDAEQVVFNQQDDNLSILYPIQDVFKHHRPRSGINKLMNLGGYIDDIPSANRPRYYVSSRQDPFKYWTSYRKEAGVEKGISKVSDPISNTYAIEDAAPFVVYKQKLPVNRIVAKVQTHVGSENKGTFRDTDGNEIADPFYGSVNSKAPSNYRIEVLRDGMWRTVYSAIEVPPADGHIELGYGILTDADIVFHGNLEAIEFLPPHEEYDQGAAFIVGSGAGTLYVNDNGWQEHTTEYGWSLVKDHHKVNKIMDPDFFGGTYREFDVIEGIRLVVNAMNAVDATLDLIEISPRIVVDLAEITSNFSVTKSMGDLSSAQLPVGSLVAGTGSIGIDNTDMALAESSAIDLNTGKGSVLAPFMEDQIKFTFSEQIYNVNKQSYLVPIKTMYSDAAPQTKNEPTEVTIDLRDAFSILEGATPPEIMLENVSLSRAIMVLLDNIGFSNYAFLRKPNVAEPVIPYFFVNPDTNVAELLAQLSESTQAAMYFDEFNNFIVAMPDYAIPDYRPTDFVMRGNDSEFGLANIKDISSSSREVLNAGEITFTKRYIQRTNRLSQSLYRDKDRDWIYSPTMVWEVSGQENTKARNNANEDQSAFALSAFPLNKDLSDVAPYVEGGIVKANVIDVGESANYYSNYKGYLWADGEIIKYDAVQFSVSGSGNVWIHSADEYQDYFLSLPFDGRIYPTGLIRIYAQPALDGSVYAEGTCERHGRGQFNTPIVAHKAGLADEWNTNVRGMFQNSEYLFTLASTVSYPASLTTDVGGGYVSDGANANDRAQNGASRTSEIRDSLAMVTGNDVDKLQASALVFTGANEGIDHVSYAYKRLDEPYNTFGTRMRVIGEILTDGSQEPIGAQILSKPFTKTPLSDLAISGGGGGIGILLNPDTNHGYFMELEALGSNEYAMEEIENEQPLGNITGAMVSGGVVKLTLASTPAGLEIGDTITVAEFPTTDLDINGTFQVTDIDGNFVYYNMVIVPFVWTAPWSGQTIVKTSGAGLATLPIDNVTRISVDATGEVVVSTNVSHGYLVGSNITVAGFESSSSIPNINGSVEVTWSNNNEFKYQIASVDGIFLDTLAGASITFGGVTISSGEMESANVSAENIAFSIAPTDKVVPELPPALAGTSLIVDRKNNFPNPRLSKVSSSVEIARNLAADTRGKGIDITKPGRFKPNWREYLATPPKTNGGLKAKDQEFIATGGPTNVGSFTRITYMSGTAWDQRGFLLAGNPNPQNVAVTFVPSAGDDDSSALPVSPSETKVQIGFWVKADKSTKAQVMGRRTDAWTKYDSKKKTDVSNEFQIGSTISVTTSWKWVSVTYDAKTAFAAGTKLHLRIKFASSSSKIAYSATGLIIQTNSPRSIVPSWFDSGYSYDANLLVQQSGDYASLYYDLVKHCTGVGNIRAQRAKVYGQDDEYTLQVLRTAKGGTSYAKVNLGFLEAGRYIISITPITKEERFKEDFIPYLVLNENESTKIENIFPRTYEEGEKNDGTRPSLATMRNDNIVIPSGGANVELRLPGVADVNGSIWYDSLHVEKVPANILTADIENLTFFHGDMEGAKWELGSDDTDDSPSVIDEDAIGVDARASVTSITGTNTLTVTTASANGAVLGQWAIFSGASNLLSAYRVSEIVSPTQFRIVTVGTAGTVSSAEVAFIQSAYITIPSLSISNESVYPVSMEQSEDGSGALVVKRAGLTEQVLINPFLNASVTKTWVETPKLFNVFFYKTVSDDRGGIVTGGSGDELIVPNHTLRRNDIVKLSGTGAPTKQYSVTNLIGDRVSLIGTDNTIPDFSAAGSWWIGMVDPLITPYRLWAGLTSIVVDTGKFYGQQKQVGQADQSVYDVCIEYRNVDSERVFHMYINDKLVGVVTDPDPLPEYNNAALFVRGQSKVMFEHFYAMAPKNGIAPTSGLAEVTNNQSRFDSVRRSGIAGPMRSAIMSGFGSGVSDYDIIYDEFGSILREAALMNVRYDQAYPALISQVAPAPAGFRGYEISGFLPSAYGAEFMVFNCTDNLLGFTEDTGNYLRILGVVFTQDSTSTITLDELLSRESDSSRTDAATVQKKIDVYNRVRNNRYKFGERKFSIDGQYVQTTAAAEGLLYWVADKVTRPRINVGIEMFSVPIIQLGDIVSFDYKVLDKDAMIRPDAQYVVYNIAYSRSNGEVSMQVYVTEV